MRKSIAVLLVLLVCIGLVAQGCQVTGSKASDRVLTLGGIFPVTGSSAVYGVNSRNAHDDGSR